MCTTCGCSDGAKLTVTRMRHVDGDASQPDHGQHQHHARDADTVRLEREVLAKNDGTAARNRARFSELGICALNLVSSPGAGKTRLLERTLADLRDTYPLAVVEGDQHTLADARRIRACGCPVVQLNTGAGCHLEAEMLAHGIDALDPAPGSLLFVENVGNLVCPALFDLGEQAKVVVLSVTEGDDKPLKYPHMFRAASLMLINKIDLLPHVDFDVAACLEHARSVNPDIQALQVSATRGDGLDAWYAWLREAHAAAALPVAS